MVAKSTPRLKVRLLGPFEVWRDGERLGPDAWDRPKTQALLKLLLCEPGRALAVDQLLDALYPDADPDKVRFNLLGRISRLRKTLEPGLARGPASRHVARAGKGAYRFVADASVWLDTQAFSEEAARGDAAWQAEAWAEAIPSLERAVALYRGEFLQDDPYEEWALPHRAHWRDAWISALERLARCHAQLGDHAQALARWDQLLDAVPAREAAHLGKMRSLLALDRRTEALAAYQHCEAALKRELGVAPGGELQALHRDLEAADQHDLPLKPTYRLPVDTTSFVGRHRELAAIDQRLKDPNCRLLTLVGLGGIGKTRLALEAVSQAGVKERFPDGVCWVSLAGVSSPDFLVSAVGDALKFTFFGQNEPEEQLSNYLREKALLLVLDNFEHLLERVELLANVLQQATKVKLLVTSRERLNLQEEWVLDVRGLPFSTPESKGSRAFEAFQMFVDRVKQMNGELASASDSRWIAMICEKVEGLPLAIELTTAWSRVMSCERIYETLEKNLDLLTSSARNLPKRHQSIQAVFEHSWDLLSVEEQNILMSLSIFRGGFTAESAEKVALANLRILKALIDKSLIQKTSVGNRYTIHSLLGEFIRQKLAKNNDFSEEAHKRFLSYCEAFLVSRKDFLLGEEQERVTQEIQREIKNIRFAWELAIAHRSYGFIESTQRCLHWYYLCSSNFQEALMCFQEALKKLSNRHKRLQLNLRIQTGYFKFRLGFLDEAESIFNDSLELANADYSWERAFIHLRLAQIMRLRRVYKIARLQSMKAYIEVKNGEMTLENKYILANIYNEKAICFHSMGKFNRSKSFHQKSFKLWNEMGYPLGKALTFNNLGVTAFEEGNYEDALTLHKESLELEKKINNRYGISLSLKNIGQIEIALGNYTSAIKVFRQCLEVEVAIGDQWAQSRSYLELGLVYLGLAKPKEAIGYIRKGLLFNRNVDDKWTLIWALNALGNAWQQLGQFIIANRFYGSALRLAEKVDHPKGILEARIGLARVHLIVGSLRIAVEHLQAGLILSLNIGQKVLLLEILGVLGETLVRKRKIEESIKILRVVYSHDASTNVVRSRAEKALLGLEVEIACEGFFKDSDHELQKLIQSLMGVNIMELIGAEKVSSH